MKNGEKEVRDEVFSDGINEQIKNEDIKKAEKKAEPVRDKSKPISSTPISGTPWYDIPLIWSEFKLFWFVNKRCVVWTGDNRVFFYNPSTRTSLWECPPELQNRSDVEKLIKGPPKHSDSESPEKRLSETKEEKPNKKQKLVSNQSFPLIITKTDIFDNYFHYLENQKKKKRRLKKTVRLRLSWWQPNNAKPFLWKRESKCLGLCLLRRRYILSFSMKSIYNMI